MTFSDNKMKEFGRSTWNDTHNITSLICTPRKKPSRWKSINTHTHTHKHTHTHWSTIFKRSNLFQKLWQHLSSLKSYQLLLHLHCAEQNPHIRCECSSVVLIPNLFSAAVNLLSIKKPTKSICIIL